MTAHPNLSRQPDLKLTSQLARGDFIHLDGIGGFAVASIQPHGEQALVRLATKNLAVICARDVRWHAIVPESPVYLHGYQACEACNGKGIVFATYATPGPAWDDDRRRWTSR